jgi:putative holliday junction resolvase
MTGAVRSGRVLALDIGRRRTGLALSDATGTLATPYGVITAHPPLGDVLRTAGQLAGESDGLAAIVVGRPLHLDGRPSAETAEVDAFIARLRTRTTLPVFVQDERLSSVEAESRLSASERDWRKRKPRLDAAAAAVILQDFLDRSPHRTGAPPDASNLPEPEPRPDSSPDASPVSPQEPAR